MTMGDCVLFWWQLREHVLADGEGVKEFPRGFASATLLVQSLRDSAAATPVGCPALRRRFRIFSFRYREMKIPE